MLTLRARFISHTQTNTPTEIYSTIQDVCIRIEIHWSITSSWANKSPLMSKHSGCWPAVSLSVSHSSARHEINGQTAHFLPSNMAQEIRTSSLSYKRATWKITQVGRKYSNKMPWLWWVYGIFHLLWHGQGVDKLIFIQG